MLGDIKHGEEYFASIFEIFTPSNKGFIGGLSTNLAIHSIFSLEMYFQIVHNSSAPLELFLEIIFIFYTY